MNVRDFFGSHASASEDYVCHQDSVQPCSSECDDLDPSHAHCSSTACKLFKVIR